MSKRCPYCDSYNTELAVTNWVERGVVNTGRAVISVGAALAGSIFGPYGAYFGKRVWETTKQEDLKGYHCCNCGTDFSA